MRARTTSEFEMSPCDLRRDERGRALAASGRVARCDDGFEVTTAGPGRATYRVWRDETTRVRCSCPEFESAEEDRFRCEHILAVKYHLEPPAEAYETLGRVPQSPLYESVGEMIDGEIEPPTS